jgi:hypothetical protein
VTQLPSCIQKFWDHSPKALQLPAWQFTTLWGRIKYNRDCLLQKSLDIDMAIDMPGQTMAGISEPVHGLDGGSRAVNENDEDDNGVTEIESLCMNCHDDVRSCHLRHSPSPDRVSGNYQNQAPSNTLLPRGLTRIILLRKLWLQEYNDQACRRNTGEGFQIHF